MKKIRLFAPRAIVLGAGLFIAMSASAPAPVRADETSDLRRQLDEQQGKLNDRLDRIERVGRVHGRYVLVRDTYLYGPDGVSKQAAAWFDATHAWVGQWEALLAIFADATPANLNKLEVQNGIRDTLKRQQDTWLGLKDSARAVYTRVAEGRAELAKIERYPESYVPNYEAHLRLLNSQLDALDPSLAKAAAGFAESEHATWNQLVAETETSVLAKLKRALLQYPDLQAAVARVQLFFQAERLLDPQVRSVQVKFNDLRDDLLQKKYFHALDALAVLRTTAAAAKTAIDGSGVDAEFANPAREDVAKTLAAGEKLFTDSTRSFTKGALVATFKGNESKRLAALCRDAEARKGLNCDLLRTLVPIQPTDIVKLSDAELRYLEFSFDKVAAGALP